MTYFIETLIGFWYLNRVTEVELVTWKDTIKPIFLKILNVLIMSIGMYSVFKIFDFQLDTSRTIWVALLTLGTSAYGLVSYILGSYLFRIKEYDDIKRYVINLLKDLKRRIKREK
jgi:hypothetical protein